VGVVGLILIIAVAVLPAVVLIRRFRSGDELESGGSAGRQIFGRKDDDWGPKP
jgi:preprotein translocase subunit SecG